MMRRLIASCGLALITVLVPGCATSAVQRAPAEPDKVEWTGLGSAVSSLTPAESFESADQLAESSDLIVIGRATNRQRGFEGDSVGSTLTDVAVHEVLLGDEPRNGHVTLYNIGIPPYVEGYYDIEDVSDPVTIGNSYLLFLRSFPEHRTIRDEMKPLDNVWNVLSFRHYMATDDSDIFALDSPDISGSMPKEIRRSEVVGAVAAAE